MSKEFLSAINGAAVGLLVGVAFGVVTLATIGFDRIVFFEGLLLLSCSAFGGSLFGSLIGASGAFRKEQLEAGPARKVAAA
jgi:hypothetical protein